MQAVLYHGGPILTMEPGPRPEALLTRGGAIAALGALSELSSLAPGARRVDLEGRTLLPAFLDPHSHITALAATLSLCQLGAANSFEQIGLALRAFAEARRLPPDAWVMGFGYDHNVLAERAHPTRQVLDRFFPDAPVLITHASGHMGVAQLQVPGPDGRDGGDPRPGGRTHRPGGRRQDPQRLSGRARLPQATAKVPMDRAADAAAALDAAQQIYLSRGITLIQDGLTGADEFQMLSRRRPGRRLYGRCGGLRPDLKKAPDLSSSPCWQTPWAGFAWGAGRSFWTAPPRVSRPGCWSPIRAATGPIPAIPSTRMKR